MPRFHNILVAMDFSQTSQDALATAVDLARTDHSRVHLLHVVPDVQVPYGTDPIAYDFTPFLQQGIAAARQRLAEAAAGLPLEAALISIEVLSGAAAAEIVDYAKSRGIDLIVLGAHGHGFVDRLLIGSVAERVARRAPCAVLLVPHVTRRPSSFEVKAAAGVES
jgi:nucleotide-binding universal stress UspA family protein